ncbi:FH1/FH2 domain-containing protein 3 [Labeo rohita]|uniref:FH1/FH2 domain-containing protein 3 n=1 Tax=Labeo rohita TaxID=84645 RepID=A0ABQ8MMI3_LABRO|nr:FH1/FH2 domain-containing protein 1 [Labeo rohita]KAI2663073.1 FH1/FH2 domain-containing protein 3 [Labeo rohita]
MYLLSSKVIHEEFSMKQAESSLLNTSWSSLVKHTPLLRLNALDFSDLWDDEDLELDSTDEDSSQTSANQIAASPIPPPPPPLAPPLPLASESLRPSGRRTLRLHWSALSSLQPVPRVGRFGLQSIWAGLEPVQLDTNRLEYLFESKSSNNSTLCSLKEGRQQKQPCVSVLGVKRSNIITIALSSLPPVHLLPPAICSMDNTVLDREDIQRLQMLVPTEEELNLIKEAKAQAPRSPLGPAEQCLLTLGNVPHLSARLQLWAFTLDHDTLEREIAEPLFHLKLAMEQLAANQTFRCILATVLAIGNFLNGCKAKGFELSYLGKLSQVKDTHGRQPLLHHVCVLLLQLYPQSSDLYSDITAVTKASKCDYTQVQLNLSQLESLCKASWDQLRLLEKDGKKKKGGGRKEEGGEEALLHQRLTQFLKDCEERLKVLRAVHRRVINRFHSFLLFLGYSRTMVRETSAEMFCKIVSDFALEYRATRNAILQQNERQEKEREKQSQNTPKLKTRFLQSLSHENQEQVKLEEVLKTPESSSSSSFHFDFTLPRQRSKTSDKKGCHSRKLKW